MKTFYMIGGTMGVGKTTTCKILKKQLPNSVFLDGDWCWDMDPFQVTEETKAMVMQNICYLLCNFLKCSAYENVIFCWVMQEQAIIDEILSVVNPQCQIKNISLVCDERALRARLIADIKAGIRTEDVIERSIERIPLYEKLDTIKLDVSRLTPEEAARRMIEK